MENNTLKFIVYGVASAVIVGLGAFGIIHIVNSVKNVEAAQIKMIEAETKKIENGKK